VETGGILAGIATADPIGGQTVGAAAGDVAAGVFSLLKAAAPTGAAPPSLVWDSNAGHGDAASERECGFREMEGQFYIELGIQS
jgi:hypothetical protein